MGFRTPGIRVKSIAAMRRRNFEFAEETHLHMIDHVFLPRHLPTESIGSDRLEKVEQCLLAMMCDVINEFEKTHIPDAVRKMFQGMQQLHCQPAKIDPVELSSQIRSLHRNQMMGIYVRNTNCALFLMRSPSEETSEMTIASFKPNLSSKEIYGTDDNINGDLQVDYPTRAVTLELSDLIRSEVFAKQVCHLNEVKHNKGEALTKSDADVSNPKYVTQWIIGAASNRNSRTADFPIISKKMRDDPGHGCFRRSGLWTTIKVLLQLGLTIAMDSATHGKYMYKLVMLKFMCTMCNYLGEYSEAVLSVDTFDTIVEMLAKLARRVDKLSQSPVPEFSASTAHIVDIATDVKGEAIECISKARHILDTHHKKMQSREDIKSKLSTLKRLRFDEHIVHQLNELKNYLAERKTLHVPKIEKTEEPTNAEPHADAFDPKVAPDIEQMKKVTTDNEMLRFLFDMENWVLTQLDATRMTPDVLYLRTLAVEYSATASQFYKKDPLGYSRMILTMLKIIQVIDSAACDDHDLFLSHRSSINTQMFENLLLTSSHHLEVLFDLQKYFVKRNAYADYPGLIEEDVISKNSFSVRFAETCEQMQDTKKEIRKKDEQNKEKKRQEVMKGRADAAKYRAAGDCILRDYRNRGQCSASCAKCSTRKRADTLRVAVYRSIVMGEDHEQNAIAFELRIPNVFACLRDVLYVFVARHYDRLMEWKKCGSWVNHPDFREFSTGHAQYVIFGTTCKKFVMKKGNRSGDLHPDRSLSDFIDDSTEDYDFLMCARMTTNTARSFTRMPIKTKLQSIKKFVTFSVEKSSVYEKLQWALESTTHTQNKVLVTKEECPADLSLGEYIAFGSLRADGHRLQYLNLYRAISDESLSFEQPSVLALIQQLLWEAGPEPNATSWYRESNEELENLKFVRAMADLLENYIERQERNWRNPLKMMVATLIVGRMFEINWDAAVADRLAKVWLRFRLICIRWIADIKQTIRECSDSDINRNELYVYVTDIAICGALTYFVNRHHKHFDKIFKTTEDYTAVGAWLLFNDNISHYNALCKDNPQRETQELLLRMAYTIGLNIELRMGALIDQSPVDVMRFVRERYVESRNGTLDGVHHSQIKRHTVMLYAIIDERRFNLEIDYVFGDFFIDGLPMGRLPQQITKLPIFQRVFGSTTFEVQPRIGVFSTVLPLKGHHYIFREHKDDGIIVQELGATTEECSKQLVPHTALERFMPFLLVENYSHWYNGDRNTIEFRPKSFSAANFGTADGIQYELDLSSGRLKHLQSDRFLLDVRSSSFQTIVALLSRLEHKDYINVLMDEKFKARVELVRMNLNFIIDCSTKQSGYSIESNEHSGMCISLKQNIGTLYGLRFGLVLEPTNESMKNRLILMPHCKFNVDRKDQHVTVEISTKDAKIRSPAFFVYRVNNECNTLRANSFAAWFYLAHLHAVTSYPLPDPFTGMTGVERAIQILQSGFAWSPAPYDSESFTTLSSLAELSPVRRFPVKQRLDTPDNRNPQTQWPSEVRHHAAQDAFVLIVRQLVAASMRLPNLFSPNEKKPQLKTHTMIELNARSHARHVPYAPNCGISKSFVKCDNRVMHFIVDEEAETTINLKNVRELAAHFNGNEPEFHVPSEDVGGLLLDLFASVPTLAGSSVRDDIDGGDDDDAENADKQKALSSIMDFCSSGAFPNLWLRLYERIRAIADADAAMQTQEKQHIHMMLTLLALEGVDIRHLQILQAIVTHPEAFSNCRAPDHASYSDVYCYEFDPVAIGKAIDSATISSDAFIDSQRSKYSEQEIASKERTLRVNYQAEIKRMKPKLIHEVHKKWPCKSIPAASIRTGSCYLNMDIACNEINQLLQSWFNNQKLREFTQQIEDIFTSKMRTLSSLSFATQPEWELCAVDTEPFPKYVIDFDRKMCSSYCKHADDIACARDIYENGAFGQLSLEQYWARFRQISIPPDEAYLAEAQLFPRLVPTTVLPKILPPRKDEAPRDADQNCLIGALAVVTCREQRAQRNTRFEQQSQMAVSLQRDQDNPLHENWHPHENPSWLLLEIEMGLCIRIIQAKIGKRMVEPPNNNHTVMQLNMGEGKTSVIVPMVAAELANGNQLCTVTVLRHLFETNLRSLRQCVGGMLQRRVYTMPCRRDMDIDSLTTEIQCIFEECKQERGILLTLPEHRLSFQLKIYDSARKGHFETASNLLKVHNWLTENSRHILDESDALLQPNYALIYTAGVQLPPDGNSLRWSCIQAVLKRVPWHMKRLYNKHSDQKIEFNLNYVCEGVDYGSGPVENRPEVFRPCRLLDADLYESLKEELARDFVNGELAIQFPEMTDAVRTQVYGVLVDKNLEKKDLDLRLNQFDAGPRKTILILSGLLKFEVLRLALTKRWRVNYGRNMLSNRKMAVPYKAKDVAAEMTEFGHPDVAICLTQLSYYYAGLSDVELRETFRLLDLSENAKEMYEFWLRHVPEGKLHKSIRSYSGVNLSDVKQRVDYLFPVLRRNMYVIDYWLSRVVFPREAKIFEKKLTCTAWDLCSQRLKHPVTGFSGTNDTKSLLPLSISQQDLPELETTNEDVRQILLRPDNDYYDALPSNTSGIMILNRMAARQIPVLLDAGALMLELNNEQVAREWLKLGPSETYDAAIYFSDKDIMLSLNRKGFITEFEYSVYREQLHRCVVYIDDVHTRGTDLQFPRSIRACVTLCGGITRDKTVQACMRMRMLREGLHTISFWASYEADVGIRKLSRKFTDGTPLTAVDVMNYVTDNSIKFEQDAMSHWLNGAQNYAKKTAAHKYVAMNAHKPEADLMKELGERCADTEYLELEELYGAKESAKLTAVSDAAFNQLRKKYDSDYEIYDWILTDIEPKVRRKLREKAGDVKRFTQILDAEYEKELEYELEQNREVSRPLTQLPMKPQFNTLLKKFCGHTDGRWKVFDQLKMDGIIDRLPLALQNTQQLYPAVKNELDAWDQNLWVTKDFRLVVQPNADVKDDEYLRSVSWIVRIEAGPQQTQDTFILISPFECNELIPTFRTQTASNATLHMFSAKLSESQSTLINNKALQLPYRRTTPRIPLNTLIQLSWFAGSTYFKDKEEESAFCNFIGIIPRPRTEEQQKAFTEGQITPTGYVPKRHRHNFPELESSCRFTENPANVTIQIIVQRHGALGKRSHVGELLYEAKRPKRDDSSEDHQMQAD